MTVHTFSRVRALPVFITAIAALVDANVFVFDPRIVAANAQ